MFTPALIVSGGHNDGVESTRKFFDALGGLFQRQNNFS